MASIWPYKVTPCDIMDTLEGFALGGACSKRIALGHAICSHRLSVSQPRPLPRPIQSCATSRHSGTALTLCPLEGRAASC